jgi:protein-L-isoaspartate(D-aspartate) O-methyltransferase
LTLSRLQFALGLAGLAMAGAGAAQAQRPRVDADERRAMVEVVRRSFWATRGAGLPGAMSEPVAAAMRTVERHEFVPRAERRNAYENRPLPIGYGQTISQPYIVALMTELAAVGRGERVLEIGTGSGYQAAVLAAMGVRVSTIEIIPALGHAAAERLRRLGYDGVATRVGDGYFGWQGAQPFAASLVTAAATHVPPPLIQQLAPGGRIVIPVGPPFVVQQLVLAQKDASGAVRTRQLLPVHFVPLTRAE